MAGFENNEQQGDVYFVTLKTKATGDWGFKVEKPKGNDQPNELIGFFPRLKNMIIREISWHTGEYQGSPIQNLKFKMHPKGSTDLYFVSMTLTQVSRGLLLKLANVNDFGDIEIATFKSDYKKDSGEKVDFIAAGLKSGSEWIKPKYDFKEHFAPLIVKQNDPVTGQEKKYYHKVDAKLRDLVEKVLAPAISMYYDTVKDSIHSGLPKMDTPPQEQVKPQAQQSGPPEFNVADMPPAPEEDDLPF